VIIKNPQVKKISIEGHASKDGESKSNKKLSDERAKAVMKWLIDKEKVNKDSLTAKGWGEDKPLDPGNTPEALEKNRRVEFLVIEQDVTKKKVEIDPTTGKEKVLETKTESIKAPDAPADTTKPATPAKPAGGAAKPTTPAPVTAPKPAEKK